jgi:hypothetical protein
VVQVSRPASRSSFHLEEERSKLWSARAMPALSFRRRRPLKLQENPLLPLSDQIRRAKRWQFDGRGGRGVRTVSPQSLNYNKTKKRTHHPWRSRMRRAPHTTNSVRGGRVALWTTLTAVSVLASPEASTKPKRTRLVGTPSRGSPNFERNRNCVAVSRLLRPAQTASRGDP